MYGLRLVIVSFFSFSFPNLTKKNLFANGVVICETLMAQTPWIQCKCIQDRDSLSK